MVYGYAPRTTVSFAGAKAYCAEPTDGYSDWRLPTRTEMLSLVDESANGPVPMAFMARTGFYWTQASSADHAWAVSLPSGELIAPEESVEAKYSLVCVRAAADLDRDGVLDSQDACSWPNKADFGLKPTQGVDANGCLPGELRISAAAAKSSQCRVDDQLFRTEKGGCRYVPLNTVISAVSPAAMTYDQANAYCASMKFQAAQKWRLPSAGELAHMSGQNLALNHLSMPADAREFWSSTTKGTTENGNNTMTWRTAATSVDLTNGKSTEKPWIYVVTPFHPNGSYPNLPEPSAASTFHHAMCVLDRGTR